MSSLTRFRIKIVAIVTIIIGFIGIPEFPRWWLFVFSWWLGIGILGIIAGAWQDHWDRLKARDVFRYIEREEG